MRLLRVMIPLASAVGLLIAVLLVHRSAASRTARRGKDRPMWLEMSLAITAILLFVVVVPIGILVLVAVSGHDSLTASELRELLPAEVTISESNDGELYIEEIEYEIAGVPLGEALMILMTASLAFGILGGIWVSRSLSRPIGQLAEAVRGIGARDLGRRVIVHGSRELTDLGQEINRMAENLEQAETVRRNLMADVAHELRTPLTVLEGNLRGILDGVYEPSEEEIAQLFKHTRHLSTLVEDLRQLALAEAGTRSFSLRETDLPNLAREAVGLFRPAAAEHGIELRLRMSESIPLLRLDTARFRQVLHNLLSNSLRHTSRGGHVDIELRLEHPRVVLSVVDDGAGIEPSELSNLFDRFFRAESGASRDVGGTGLGLAITKAVVEAHGGSISAESAGIGCGARFTVHLPVA